jgi:hypothetical protein
MTIKRLARKQPPRLGLLAPLHHRGRSASPEPSLLADAPPKEDVDRKDVEKPAPFAVRD